MRKTKVTKEETMTSKRHWLGAGCLVGGLALAAATAGAQDKELVFGLQCDRTGATQTVGVFLCPGYHDYINLLNSKGGIEGYKVKVLEIDNEYKILGTSPGFGTAAATDGKRYPYTFPIAASYWSQGAAAVAFAKKQLGG